MIYLPCFSILDSSGNFSVPQGKLREFVSAKFVGTLKKHIHYPQLLGTFYKFSEIISLKKSAQGKTIYNANFIQTFVRNAMR